MFESNFISRKLSFDINNERDYSSNAYNRNEKKAFLHSLLLQPRWFNQLSLLCFVFREFKNPLEFNKLQDIVHSAREIIPLSKGTLSRAYSGRFSLFGARTKAGASLREGGVRGGVRATEQSFLIVFYKAKLTPLDNTDSGRGLYWIL